MLHPTLALLAPDGKSLVLQQSLSSQSDVAMGADPNNPSSLTDEAQNMAVTAANNMAVTTSNVDQGEDHSMPDAPSDHHIASTTSVPYQETVNDGDGIGQYSNNNLKQQSQLLPPPALFPYQHYPKPGNGIRIPILNEDDLNLLMDDDFLAFSHLYQGQPVTTNTTLDHNKDLSHQSHPHPVHDQTTAPSSKQQQDEDEQAKRERRLQEEEMERQILEKLQPVSPMQTPSPQISPQQMLHRQQQLLQYQQQQQQQTQNLYSQRTGGSGGSGEAGDNSKTVSSNSIAGTVTGTGNATAGGGGGEATAGIGRGPSTSGSISKPGGAIETIGGVAVVGVGGEPVSISSGGGGGGGGAGGGNGNVSGKNGGR